MTRDLLLRSAPRQGRVSKSGMARSTLMVGSLPFEPALRAPPQA